MVMNGKNMEGCQRKQLINKDKQIYFRSSDFAPQLRPQGLKNKMTKHTPSHTGTSAGMDCLPVEIWIQIISMTSKRDQLSLSTTCKFVGNIAQASLCKTVCVINENHKDTTKRGVDAFQAFLTKKSGMSALIQDLSLKYLSPQPPSPEHQKMYHSWLHYFPTFSNLQKLTLCGFYLDPDFHTTLHNLDLRYLRTLSLQMCIIDTISRGTPAGVCFENLISELILDESKLLGVSPPIICTEARRLTVCHWREPEQTDKILSSYMSPSIIRVLSALKVDVFSEALLHFLEASSQLRQLELYLIFDVPPPPGELSINALPLLETFAGPAQYAGIFITGRPVRTARLTLEDSAPPGILLHLQDSAVSVTELQLSCRVIPSKMEQILQHLPCTLHHLAWHSSCFLSKSETVSQISSLPHLPNLRVFEFCAPKLWECSANFIDIPSKSTPTIQEFAFLNSNNDCDRWLRRGSTAWEWYIVPRLA